MKNLMKIQLKGMLFRMRQSGGKRASGALIVGLLIFCLLCIELVFVALWAQMTVFCTMGLAWLYFSLAGILALALAVFGSVFMTQTQLYDAKDNELLLSMPIRPMQILMSRMAVLLVLTGVFTLAALLPAYIMYAAFFGVTVQIVVGWVLSAAALILLAQAVCCALGWVLHWLLSRIRNKAVVSMTFTVLFLVVYFYVYTNANNLLTQLMQSGEQIAAAVQGAAWPLYAVGMGMGGSLPHTLFTAVLGAGVFALVSWALAASFAKTVTAGSRSGAARRRRGRRDMRVKTPVQAICHKELRKFLTSAVYLTNFGLGLVLLVALPVAALIFRGQLLEAIGLLDGFRPFVAGVVVLAAAFCIATSCISAPSISLEGKSLWVIRSLPVSGRTVLRGKLRMHCMLLVPLSAVCVLALGLIVGCSVVDTLLAAAICAVFGWFVGVAGLVCNLLAPRFDWINEAGPCKQSAAVFLTIFGSYFVMLAFGGLFALLYSFGLASTLCLAACAAVLLLLTAGFHALLMRWGGRRFETL